MTDEIDTSDRERVETMTDNSRADERKEMLALADALFDDLFEAADEEILEELREAGHTPETLQQERQKNLNEAEQAAGAGLNTPCAAKWTGGGND